jgi:hypothetical protein
LLEAIDRGEIDPEVDRDVVFDLVYGGLMYRVLVGEPVDEGAAQALADLVMTGAAGPQYRNRSSKAVARAPVEATAKG